MTCVMCSGDVEPGHEAPDVCESCMQSVLDTWCDEPPPLTVPEDHLQRCGAVMYLADAYGVSHDKALCLAYAYMQPQGMRQHAGIYAIRRKRENGEDRGQ